MKKNFIYVLIFLLLLINIVLGIYNFLSLKRREVKNIKREYPLETRILQDETFYNSPSPDFSKKSIDGKEIHLSSLKGNLIILRFSRFYFEELPYLLYLEHLSKRFKNDVSLIFINSLGKHYKESIEKFVHLSSPVIEDDGSISSSFKASPFETIIIGRDFRIKFKYGRADNRTIYNQVVRFAFDGKSPEILKDEELEVLIKGLSFKNVRSGKISKKVEEEVKGKPCILNLFISTCMECPEARRVSLLKELAEKEHSKVEVLILFGIGNGEEMIREWVERMGFGSRVKVGIIKDNLSENDYLNLFRFDIDPRIIILDRSGKIIYSEKEGDERLMSYEFLRRRL